MVSFGDVRECVAAVLSDGEASGGGRALGLLGDAVLGIAGADRGEADLGVREGDAIGGRGAGGRGGIGVGRWDAGGGAVLVVVDFGETNLHGEAGGRGVDARNSVGLGFEEEAVGEAGHFDQPCF